tara:strand:+ start:421 stop:678 length:258 start_codon:yes stop_codon:yes gene_type:complete
MEGYYYDCAEDCYDDCIACLIGECDHTYNLQMTIEHNKERLDKVIKGIEQIFKDWDIHGEHNLLGDVEPNYNGFYKYALYRAEDY